jgi:hypothetical protein
MGNSRVDIPDSSAAPQNETPVDPKTWNGLWKTIRNIKNNQR